MTRTTVHESVLAKDVLLCQTAVEEVHQEEWRQVRVASSAARKLFSGRKQDHGQEQLLGVESRKRRVSYIASDVSGYFCLGGPFIQGTDRVVVRI